MGDPHRGQGRILALLKLQPEIDQRELALILDIRPQSLGELLAKLERQAYLTRSPSESDRRVMEIRLTEAGKAAAEESPQSQDAEALFGVLTEEEKTAFGEYLERLIADWGKTLGADSEDAGFRMGRGGMGSGRRGGGPGLGFGGGHGPGGGRGGHGPGSTLFERLAAGARDFSCHRAEGNPVSRRNHVDGQAFFRRFAD